MWLLPVAFITEVTGDTLQMIKRFFMVGFVLTGHGQFSTGLATAIHMVAGDTPYFETVTFDNDEAATFSERLSKTIHEMRSACTGVVVFCDLLGGTPFNQSMMCAAEVDNVTVVCGTNLPMMIEALFTRMSNDDATADELANIAISAGKDAVVLKHAELLEQSDDCDNTFSDDEDGI